MNRALVIVLGSLLFLAMVSGCASSPAKASFSSKGGVAAARSGKMALSLRVTRRPGVSGLAYDAQVTLANEGGDPITLLTPGGVRTRIVVVSAAGKTAFDSLPVDRATIATDQASQPATWPALDSGSMVLGSGVSDSASYSFALPAPGAYTVTATTFGPKIVTEPVGITAK